MRLFAAALLLATCGCGYHVAGRADLMPKTIKTIAIPAFTNKTTRYNLARMLPADLTREFITRTRFAVVADPREADAVLQGELGNFVAYPIASDPGSGRATAVQIAVTLDIALTDRGTGKPLFDRKGMEYRERYEVSLNPRAYLDESGAAAQRVSRDVARTVVSAILEDF